MKKIYLLISAVIVIILAVNIYYYLDIYDQQIDFQKSFLQKQSQICGYELEQTGSEFENELNKILYSYDLTRFFDDEETQTRIIKQYEIFCSRFEHLILNFAVYDNQKNVFSLFRDKKNQFISDNYTTHDQGNLEPREKFEAEDNVTTYYFPVFTNNVVTGNIVITLDYIRYFSWVFEKSHLGATQWQWLVDMDRKGKILFNNLTPDPLDITQQSRVTAELMEGIQGSLKHSVIVDGEEDEIISAYYPTRVLGRNFGIVFSLKTEFILKAIVKNAVIMAVVTLLLIMLIIIIFMITILRKKSEDLQMQDSERALKLIVDSLPVGVLVLGGDNRIRRVNRIALEMLSLEEDNTLIGKDITGRFQIGKNLLHTHRFGAAFDTNQFITYVKDGSEMVILKKEIPVVLQGEEVLLMALIDVTPFEKSRKQEVLANEAKSDFLAKMSHEIRTPLNGIIGMAEAFAHQELNKEQQEIAVIIRRSADLLLSIINDILDFSKIEAGKMILEEIPFRLRHELQFTLQLFRAKANEKELELNFTVANDVPDNIIGDPFRIRQVLSNLVDNAIKFTQEGKVEVIVIKAEEYAGNITLQVDVEDTGIGIPSEHLDEIFRSYIQADGSTSRKYGGTGLGTTIAKQLVNLMGGDIRVESPSRIFINPDFPGSRFSFTIEVFSNEKIPKDVNFEEITKYHQIKALIIMDKAEKDDLLFEALQNFGISCYVTTFQERTIELVKSNLTSKPESYKVIFIEDTKSFDGFQVAQKLYQYKLSNHFLIVLITSNDRKGNFARSRKLGIDHYLIQPFQSSEIFDIIQENFTQIKFTEEDVPTIETIRKDLKILVAEDNLINQKVAKSIFKNLGFEVTIAVNGEEVINTLGKETFDIIFMDIMMPQKDGFDATRGIRELGYRMPIIAVTADTNYESRQKVLEAGMDDFIPKPIRVDEIKRVLIKNFSDPVKKKQR